MDAYDAALRGRASTKDGHGHGLEVIETAHRYGDDREVLIAHQDDTTGDDRDSRIVHHAALLRRRAGERYPAPMNASQPAIGTP